MFGHVPSGKSAKECVWDCRCDRLGLGLEWGLECLYTQMHFNSSLHVATVSSHYFYQTLAGTLQRTQENITSNPAASEELYLYSALSLTDTRTLHDWRLTQTSYIELTRSLTFNLLKKQSFNPEGECWYPHCLLIDAQAYVWVWMWEVEFLFRCSNRFYFISGSFFHPIPGYSMNIFHFNKCLTSTSFLLLVKLLELSIHTALGWSILAFLNLWRRILQQKCVRAPYKKLLINWP